MSTRMVAYAGRDDLRILDGNDLRKAGVSGFHKTEFRKGEPVEVEEEVMVALQGNPSLFGRFEVIEEREAEDEDSESATDDKPSGKSEKADKK